MMTLKQTTLTTRLDELLASTELLLTEEIDQETLQAAIQTIKKLQAIDLSALPTLDRGRETLLTGVMGLLAGDKKSLGQRLRGLFGGGNEQLYDALAFGSALQNFFTSFSQYIMAIATKNRVTMGDERKVSDVAGEYVQDAAIRRFITNNLKPKGSIFSKYGKGWSKAVGDINSLGDEIMSLTLGQLKTIVVGSKSIGQSIPTVNMAPGDIKQQPPSAPGAQPDDLGGGEAAASGPTYKAVWAQIKNEIGPVDAQQRGLIAKVLKTLEKGGHFKK